MRSQPGCWGTGCTVNSLMFAGINVCGSSGLVSYLVHELCLRGIYFCDLTIFFSDLTIFLFFIWKTIFALTANWTSVSSVTNCIVICIHLSGQISPIQGRKRPITRRKQCHPPPVPCIFQQFVFPAILRNHQNNRGGRSDRMLHLQEMATLLLFSFQQDSGENTLERWNHVKMQLEI